MLHVRVACPSRLTDQAVDALGHHGRGGARRGPGASLVPEGDVLECDVVREASDNVVAALLTIDTDRELVISIVELEVIAGRAVRAAEAAAPGYDADALPWALIEADAREAAEPSATFFVLMALAAVIAAIGIVVDSAVLIIGAMIVGPEYGPITAVAVGVHRRRRFGDLLRSCSRPARGRRPRRRRVRARRPSARRVGRGVRTDEPVLHRVRDRPNAYSAVVAFVAGVAGTIALARSQATVVAGVLVSVTTIPAAAAVGVGMAAGQWDDAGDGAIQLGDQRGRDPRRDPGDPGGVRPSLEVGQSALSGANRSTPLPSGSWTVA